MSDIHLGVDIGGTKIDVVACLWSGEVLHRHRTPTARGNQQVVSATTAAVTQLSKEMKVAPRDFASVGVGVAGTVQDGVVGYSMNLDITRLDLAAALASTLGQRPAIDNDVNAAAVGVWVLDHDAKGSLAFLNLGTGLAAGMILGGKLWRGAHGAAGEIGYISVDPTGPADIDGLRGGLEIYAGGCGVVLQAQRDGVTAMEVLTRADEVPAWATIRDSLYFGVASAVRTLVLTLDVDRVVLGGGLTGLGDSLVDGTRSVIAGWERQSPFLASVAMGERIWVTDVDRPVAAIGAAMRGAGRG